MNPAIYAGPIPFLEFKLKTAQLAQSLNLSGLTVLSLNSKNGIGPAYIAGFKFGLTKNYDF
ncbi:MAG: hypothetical protein ACKPKO_55615, partial [Candidatus Fonsibacter sp.]